MFDVVIAEQRDVPVGQREVEFVERKGIGHPDTICDSVMESISLELSRIYLEAAGHILVYEDNGRLTSHRNRPGTREGCPFSAIILRRGKCRSITSAISITKLLRSSISNPP